MKRSVIALVVFSVTLGIFAQVPDAFSYQAVVRNSSGALITNSKIGMKISILQGSTTGSTVYSETHEPNSNANGLVSIEIGSGSGSGDFSSINWGNGPFYIKSEFDPNGGTNYSVSGVSQILSVPYAQHAKTASKIQGGHYVGELYGGGIVFWVSPDGEHGLIAALDDIQGGISFPWSNVVNGLIGPDAQSMTDGVANTDAMISQAGHSQSAAKYCRDYNGGGFSDWYLPSLKELSLLAQSDYLIDFILDNDDDSETHGFGQEYVSPAYGKYWSSTEVNFTNAWNYNFAFGNSNGSGKESVCKIRPIRAF